MRSPATQEVIQKIVSSAILAFGLVLSVAWTFLFGYGLTKLVQSLQFEIDQIIFVLLIAAAGFASGYAAGADMSRRHREKAKHERIFFDNDPHPE